MRLTFFSAVVWARGAGSALQQGPHIPLPRVHHRSPGVLAVSSLPLPRSGCAQHVQDHANTEQRRTGLVCTVSVLVGTEVTRMAYRTAG